MERRSLWLPEGVGVIDPNQLLAVDEEGAVPIDEIWVNLQLMHFGEQYIRLYCTEYRGEVYE